MQDRASNKENVALRTDKDHLKTYLEMIRKNNSLNLLDFGNPSNRSK